jgi:hypothetical protein
MRRFVPGRGCDLVFEEGAFGQDGSLFSTTVRELQPPMSLEFINELVNQKELVL